MNHTADVDRLPLEYPAAESVRRYAKRLGVFLLVVFANLAVLTITIWLLQTRFPYPSLIAIIVLLLVAGAQLDRLLLRRTLERRIKAELKDALERRHQRPWEAARLGPAGGDVQVAAEMRRARQRSVPLEPTMEDQLQEALVLARKAGDKRHVMLLQQNLAAIAAGRDDYGKAAVILQEALALAREAADWPLAAAALRNLAVVLHNRGVLAANRQEYDGASEYLTQALAVARETQDALSIGRVLHALAVVAAYHRQYDAARAYLEEALVLTREAGETAMATAKPAADLLTWITRVAKGTK